MSIRCAHVLIFEVKYLPLVKIPNFRVADSFQRLI